MKFADRSPITDDKTRAAAEAVDEIRGRQAVLVVAGHSTNAQDCIELLEMLGLTDLSRGRRDAPRLAPLPHMF
jgi:hypothetical protein